MSEHLTSYAQNAEDVVLWRALQHVTRGFYVDVGSYDPDEDSVTKIFYQNGWNGINIEPNPVGFGKFINYRKRDINLNVGVAAASGYRTFYCIADTGLSTMDGEIARKHAESGRIVTNIYVPVLTLRDIYTQVEDRTIHFLKIDVEGTEMDVLEGADFNVVRPWIIVAETISPITRQRDNRGFKEFFAKYSYSWALFDGINDFFVADEQSEIKEKLVAGANLLDQYRPIAWVRDTMAILEARQENDRLERTLVEKQRTANDIEAALLAAQERADGLERMLVDNQQTANDLGAALSAAQERADGLERMLVDNQQTANDLDAALSAAQHERGRLQTMLEETEHRAAATHESLQAAVAQSANAEEQAASAHQRADLLREILAQREALYVRLRDSITYLETRISELQDTLTAERNAHIMVLEAERTAYTAALNSKKDQVYAQMHRWFEAATSSSRPVREKQWQYTPRRARVLLNRLLRSLPVGLRHDLRVLTSLADNARDQGRWELAARFYRQALDLDADCSPIWVQLGHALKEAGEPEAGEKAYRAALEREPNNHDTHLHLGHALKLQGRLLEAAEAYYKALGLAPNTQNAYALYELVSLGHTVPEIEHTLGGFIARQSTSML